MCVCGDVVYVSEREARSLHLLEVDGDEESIALFFCNYWVTLELRGNMAALLAANCEPLQ